MNSDGEVTGDADHVDNCPTRKAKVRPKWRKWHALVRYELAVINHKGEIYG